MPFLPEQTRQPSRTDEETPQQHILGGQRVGDIKGLLTQLSIKSSFISQLRCPDPQLLPAV